MAEGSRFAHRFECIGTILVHWEIGRKNREKNELEKCASSSPSRLDYHGEWKSVGKLTKTNRSMLNLFSYGSDDSDSGIEEVYLVGKLVDV